MTIEHEMKHDGSKRLGDLEMRDGFYPLENDDLGAFAWARKRFSFHNTTHNRFLLLNACYNGEVGNLSLTVDGRQVAKVPLAKDWASYPIDLLNCSTGDICFELDEVPPTIGDTRELGLMVRSIEIVNESRLEICRKVTANKVLNQKEFHAGANVLQSSPVGLRVSMEMSCNIHPPCAYCEYDWAEKHVPQNERLAFTRNTMDEMGQFYSLADAVVDCSLGEPFMNRDIPFLLNRIRSDGKFFEMASNGQLLNEANLQHVLGMKMRLYISLDAATDKTYAFYRNGRFAGLMDNLKTLCQEKRNHGNWPNTIVSFLAMRTNHQELPRFLTMMKELGVDAIKIRSLNETSYLRGQAIARSGGVFCYDSERLSLQELHAVGIEASAICSKLGLRLFLDWDFGTDANSGGNKGAGIAEKPETTVPSVPADAGEGRKTPLCSEPWQTMYVLMSGILPCCYGYKPVAKWPERKGRRLVEFMSDIYNGNELRKIREALAEGKLSDYCRKSQSCPIVKRAKGCAATKSTLP